VLETVPPSQPVELNIKEAELDLFRELYSKSGR